MFDAKTRAASAAEPARLRRRVRRPRHRRRAHDRGGCRALLEPPRAGHAPTSPTRTPSCRASSRSSATPPASSRRSPSTNAHLFTSMADTFEARRARPRGAASQTISKAPPTMDAAIESFRVQRPFLADLTTFSKDFSGATARAARRAADAQPRRSRSARRCRSACPRSTSELERDARRAPRPRPRRRATNAAHPRRSTATVTTLNPQLRFYGPYVTVCNAPNYFFTYLAEHFSEADSTGSAQRALLNFAGQQDDSLGSMGADEPANGKSVKQGNDAVPARTSRTARRSRPTGAPTARPASAASSSATRASTTSKYKIDQRPAHARRRRARRSRAARACRRARRSRAIPETGPYSTMPPSASGER